MHFFVYLPYFMIKKTLKNIFGTVLGIDPGLNVLRSCLRKQIIKNDYNSN